MKNTIRASSVLLGLIVAGLCYLQALQQQTLLPLNADARGFMNFSASSLRTDEVRARLLRFGSEEGVEIYQITSPSATLRTDVYARGGNQPTSARDIAWLQPGKVGTLYPANESPPDLVSGVYVLKGSREGIQRLRDWASGIGAIHAWENISFLMLFFLPLAYQGVVLTLLVTIILLASVVLAWYARKSQTRAMRVLGGVPSGQIHLEDTTELMRLIAVPSAITAGAGIVVAAVLKGTAAAALVLPALGLLLTTYLAVAGFGLLISALTWPTTAHLAHRLPASTRFSWPSAVLLYLAVVTLVACVPFIQLTLDRARDNEATAVAAAKLPTYYSMNFGLVLDHQRDYDSKVPDMARIILDMERDDQVAYLEYLETPHLAGSEFAHVALYNQRYFQDLSASQPDGSFQEIPAASVPDEVREAITGEFAPPGSGTEIAEAIRFFTPTGEGRAIAIRGSGIFESRPDTLIAVVPRIGDFASPEALVSSATRGAVLYRDPQRVAREASRIGVNLTFDNVSDTIRLFANDQRLGFQVTVFSTISLGVAFSVLVVTSSAIHALRKSRALLPRYLQGVSWWSLLWRRLSLDAAVILASCAVGAAICAGSGFYEPLIPILVTGAALLAGTSLSRRALTRQVLVSMIQRKD